MRKIQFFFFLPPAPRRVNKLRTALRMSLTSQPQTKSNIKMLRGRETIAELVVFMEHLEEIGYKSALSF